MPLIAIFRLKLGPSKGVEKEKGEQPGQGPRPRHGSFPSTDAVCRGSLSYGTNSLPNPAFSPDCQLAGTPHCTLPRTWLSSTITLPFTCALQGSRGQSGRCGTAVPFYWRRDSRRYTGRSSHSPLRVSSSPTRYRTSCCTYCIYASSQHASS